jgi:phosphomannomutase
MSLMVSISGIRGVVGESLTPDVPVRYASAFAEYCGRGRIVIGRDGRTSGKMIGNLVSSTLIASGCDVIALGVAPTPTIQIAVEQLHAAGGISITASHNPVQWNGMKFIGTSGMFLNGSENAELWRIADRGTFGYARWNELGAHTLDDSFIRQHIDMVLSLPYINVEMIRKRKFKVVVDCINGSGGVIVPQMLRNLGCEVVEMFCDVSGLFAHNPEPIPENLTDLCRRVVAEGADFGISVDPDADRLVFIDERGIPYGEEYTIASVVNFVLGQRRDAAAERKSVVVNLSTTRAVEDIAARFDAPVFRTPVGEINVAKKMKELGAVVGGEGSGGVILPAVHYGRDSIVGIGLMMQQLSGFNGRLSEFKSTLPQYSIFKTKVEIEQKNPDMILEKLKSRFSSEGRTNVDDGLTIDFKDSWVHLRKSNTEPIVRIIAEAPSTEGAEELASRFKNEILNAG